MNWQALYCTDEKRAEHLAKQLNAHDVMAAPHQLTIAGNAFYCVVFPEADHRLAMRALGLPEVLPSIQTDDSTYELIFDRPVISLLPQWSSNAMASTALAQAFARDVGVCFIMVYGWGAALPVITMPRSSNDVFRLCFYAVPPHGQQPPQVTQLSVAFGMALPNVNLLSPSGLGKPIQTPEGYTVAEVLPGNLYVLLDLVNTPSNSDMVFLVLSRILEQALPLTTPVGVETEREEYAWLCSTRARVRHALLEFKLREVTSELERTSKLMALKAAEQEQVLAELEALRQRQGSLLLQEYMQEYDQLITNNPHIEKITIEDNKIHVQTNEILLNYANATRVMGRYHLYIPLEGGTVSIVNEAPKRTADGRIVHHPHVVDEMICLGELAGSIANLIARREYAEAIQELIGFLHQFNPLDHYREYLSLWEPLRRPRPCSCEINKKGVKS